MASKKRKDEAQTTDEDPTTPFDNFQQLLKQVLSIPKEELDRRRAEYKRKREKKG
jgi:hypothetical protein